ncbi:hypothetical protein SRABI26_03606 [Arthrobacter sp. Bi26]|nr:hypothetical protein SRABI26_03606 [Arthrobacter sp. Bi26]
MQTINLDAVIKVNDATHTYEDGQPNSGAQDLPRTFGTDRPPAEWRARRRSSGPQSLQTMALPYWIAAMTSTLRICLSACPALLGPDTRLRS